MNDELQLPCFREAFYRREARSVPAARKFTAQALAEWGADTAAGADAVLLCVSELATNALLHGVPPGRGFRLHLYLEREGLLRVEMHDSGGGTVRTPELAPNAETGRGLLLVAALADKWGVGERDPGKVVWCEFAVRG
ncbi:ATP-binding protein [Streptomyces sp. H27-C3]|uniref:ATP-binding protein n=1 Tax=Streptomyces sp. H27-C3 TaxID=3046305 RepID=UPI0024BBD1AF|nr:ATP-binding protein [Streptomyces sp. H27-C3]MDJ0460841.1 ATP-binding protein [Streptomyces sp. H27-C3]